LIVLDIDHFKPLNDTHGHNVGDQALREVAKALHSVRRPYDLCARYAGDEFVLVLANCPREAAEARRRELQQRISEVTLEIWPEQTLRFDASAGVSVFPDDGTTYEALIAAADRRMYQDKADRRRKGMVLPRTENADAVVFVRPQLPELMDAEYATAAASLVQH
jgi:diguanylate cyclase (GGDEF)-like protein